MVKHTVFYYCSEIHLALQLGFTHFLHGLSISSLALVTATHTATPLTENLALSK